MFCPYCGKESGVDETCGKPECLAAAAAESDELSVNLAAAANRPAMESDALFAARAEIWRSLDDGKAKVDAIAEQVVEHGAKGPAEAMAPLVEGGEPYVELDAISDAVEIEITHLNGVRAEVKNHQDTIRKLKAQRARRARILKRLLGWTVVIGIIVILVVTNGLGG